jgi:tripartite-type tricarboxylate transporter receptor subunit TctC
MNRRGLSAIVLCAYLQVVMPAQGQEWPIRPMTLVVPFAAGGAVDTTARILAPRLSEILGQPVLIENIAGAGGMIAGARVAKASRDGYQFILGSAGTHAFSQTIYKKPLYDSASDFAPVGIVTRTSFVLIARKDLPADTLPEFAAYVKSNHTKMQYASAGSGSTTHIVCALLNSVIGAEVSHVPYRSTTIAVQDMIAGHVDYICEPTLTAMPQIQGSTVKAIAFLGTSRTSVLRNLATATEQGFSELSILGWNALFLPKGTAEAIVRRLSNAVSEAMDTPSVRARIEGLGDILPPPEQRTPEYLSVFLPAEIMKWAVPIKGMGVSVE